MYDIIIIGGGPAGITAGIYAQSAGMDAVIFEKMGTGGQIMLTDTVENYPGFTSISGPDLGQKFEEHALKVGVEIKYEEVQKVETKGNIHKVTTDGDEYESIAVIVATGSQPRKLQVEGEEKFTGRGVSYCAVCDGAFFRDKVVAVIGGGDAAIKEALYLTSLVKKVMVVHRRDKLRAENILQEQAFNNVKIEFVWDSVVEKIMGDDKFKGLMIKNVKNPDEKEVLKVDGVFIYVGSNPNTQFVNVEKTSSGQIITNSTMETNVPGIYGAGDCRNTPLKQITTCVGDGALAAYTAADYVEKFKGGFI